MCLEIFGNEYDLNELRQIVATEEFFKQTMIRVRRRGERSANTELPNETLRGRLNNDQWSVYLDKLKRSALIDEASSSATFWFSNDRFGRAIAHAKRHIAEQAQRDEAAQREQEERSRREEREDNRHADEERGRRHTARYQKVKIIFGALTLIIATCAATVGVLTYLQDDTDPPSTEHPDTATSETVSSSNLVEQAPASPSQGDQTVEETPDSLSGSSEPLADKPNEPTPNE